MAKVQRLRAHLVVPQAELCGAGSVQLANRDAFERTPQDAPNFTGISWALHSPAEGALAQFGRVASFALDPELVESGPNLAEPAPSLAEPMLTSVNAGGKLWTRSPQHRSTPATALPSPAGRGRASTKFRAPGSNDFGARQSRRWRAQKAGRIRRSAGRLRPNLARGWQDSACTPRIGAGQDPAR